MLFDREERLSRDPVKQVQVAGLGGLGDRVDGLSITLHR